MNLRLGENGSWPAIETRTGLMRMKVSLIILLISLTGCYAGTVKPFVTWPEFKVENEPVRTLRILIVTDGSYRKEEMEKLVSKSSAITEVQVGIRLEIVDSHEIKWDFGRSDSSRMLAKIATETWEKTSHFDIAVAFAYFDEKSDEPYRSHIGLIDGVFWRYIVVKEPEPNLFLHEVIHAFLPGKEHAKKGLMQPVRPNHGNEWYWLSLEERKEVLRNKWRDFNAVPATGDKRGTTRECGYHYFIGLDHLRRKEYHQAVSFIEKSIEVDPDYAPPFNVLAWFLATTEQKGMRDGKRAVELALKACELTEWKNAQYLDTLAAAYARTDEFAQAVKWQEKAVEGMKSFDHYARREAQERLRLYRNRKPVPPD